MTTLGTHPSIGRNGTIRSATALVGEVIESSSIDFVAQACKLDEAPVFGSFVRVTADPALTIYGVVANVETAGIDPGARPIMRGHDDVRDERIYEENPDLPHVLRTVFRVLVLGFAERGTVRQFLPPRPPRLHYSVFAATSAEVESFANTGMDYLATLLAAPEVPNDELVAAVIRLVARDRHDAEPFLQGVGRELAQLLRGDYPRLTAILRRLVVAQSVGR